MMRDNKNENKFSFLKFYFVPIGIGTILLSQNHKTSADGIPYKNRFSPFLERIYFGASSDTAFFENHRSTICF